MFTSVQPPAPQALERRLWCNLELRYWLYLAGALGASVLDLAFGPGAWWQKALLCGVVLSLSALPAARWGGVHLDSHLWWEGRHALHLLGVALSHWSTMLWAGLRRHGGRAGTHAPVVAAAAVAGRREASPCAPMVRWWQERDWDALDREASTAGEEEAAWDTEREAQEEDEAAAEDAGAAGWVDDWAGTWQEEEAPGWVDDWAALPPTRLAPHTEQGPGIPRTQLLPRRTPASARAAGLAWDAATASAYDPCTLFLLDQSPCFQLPAPSAARRMLAGRQNHSHEGWSVLGAEAKGA
jgi:hypothetical protein